MITITANTRQAVVTNKELLTSGSAGIQVQFTLSNDFNGLSCIGVFRVGDDGKRVDVILDNTLSCAVPPETLAEEGEVLFIGVYGANSAGTVIIPTVWASAGVVKPGTEPNVAANAEPTPEIWAQILSVAEDAEEAAGDALSAATRAEAKVDSVIETCADTEAAAIEAKDAAEIASASAVANGLKAEGHAVGQQNGTPVGAGSPYYQNNAQFYAGQAATSASNAANSEGNASGSASSAAADALKAEGFAVGEQNGTAVASDSPYYENNAAYYAGVAAAVLESIPEDYSELSDDVDSLKSAITVVVEEKTSKNLYDSSKIESGFINQTYGNVESESTHKHSDYIPVETTFVISVESLLNTGFRYAIYNSAKQYITGASSPTFSEAASGRYYLVVTNANAAYLRFSDRNSIMLRQWQVENGSTPTSYEAYFPPYYTLNDELIIPTNQVNELPEVVSGLSAAESDIDDLQDAVSDVSETVAFDKYITDIYTTPYNSGYMATNGAVSSSTTFDYTDKISVQPGDVLYGETTDGTELCTFRFVCAFSGDTAVSAKGNGSDLGTYTVPEGIDGVVVSQRKAPSGKTRSVRIERVRELETTNLKKTPMGYMRASGDLSSGEELHVAENNVKNNVCVAFSGNVTTFSKLYIGQRKGTSWKQCYIEIDSTNITIHTDQGNATAAHGLTIGSDIQVLIETHHDAETSLIRICSDGNAYNDTTPHRWLCDEGYPAVVSDGSALTDCALTWTSRNINEPVWIFGDSYVSLYDVRWVYWMIQDGFDMPMINGYAGEPSQNAMISLKNLLECRQPQYILWALGMNDADSDSAVNTSWKRNYDIFIGLCKQYGITPILATIPNVPTVNNSFKNAIIRASGYRYIDFSKAVDPDEDGTWIGNTLSLDGVHPTVDGARVLYLRALADFPELTSL